MTKAIQNLRGQFAEINPCHAMPTGPIGQQGSLRPPLKGETRLLEFKVQEGITDQPVEFGAESCG